MKTALIFDLDGTLWDATTQALGLFNEMLLENSCLSPATTLETFQSCMGKSKPEIIKILLGKDPLLVGQAIFNKFEVAEVQRLEKTGGTLYPNVCETLAVLNKTCDFYIVSNCQCGYIEAFLKSHHLASYFLDFESYGNTQKEKADNIKMIIDRNAIERAYYVGDTVGDEESASKAGIPFVHASYGFGFAVEPQFKISNFKSLLRLPL